MIYTPPIKDMLFLLNEWIGLDKLTSLPGYEEVDADLIEAILEEAGKFCSTELLEINRDGDEHGAIHEGDSVHTPPGFKEAYAELVAGAWGGLAADPAYGGQGLPHVIANAFEEYMISANMAFTMRWSSSSVGGRSSSPSSSRRERVPRSNG